MENFELLVDLHRHNDRQGPGGEAETLLALRLAGLDGSAPLAIADVGCGTGASALLLARELDAHLTAVDLVPEFIDELRDKAAAQGLADRIAPQVASMAELPFEDESFDAIWSEGAVYNIGFGRGVNAWRRYLKPGGVLVVSEITWLNDERPDELTAFWNAAYPEIDTAPAKLSVLERSGYTPIGYFVLSRRCWLENYYRPLQGRFEAFLARHGHGAEARALVRAQEEEIALYERYGDHFSYGFYIARKSAWPVRR
jgi:SAM-dependent methyltransferase